MDLALSELKVGKEVPALNQQEFQIFLDKRKSPIRSTRKVTWLFKLCCNVFCEPTEWFVCFVKLYINLREASHQVEWERLA